MVAWKKYYKKSKKYSRQVYKKSGLVNPIKKGNLSMTRVIKDLALLKKMINAEKQNVETNDTTEYRLGQFNGLSSGGQVLNILPTISQGVSEDQRKGDSLKVCSWVLKIQTYNAGNFTVSGINYKFYVLRQPTNPVALASVSSQFLETNPFSGVIDYFSNRDYEHYKDWIVMGTITGKLKANESQDTGQGAKQNVHTLARKQEFHIRYDKGTNTPLNNNIVLLAVASDGDRATTNTMFFKYSFKVYYYDN